jgi:hypothetical protein
VPVLCSGFYALLVAMGLTVFPRFFSSVRGKRDRSGRVESYLLAPYLAQLFDWCFQRGTAPDVGIVDNDT